MTTVASTLTRLPGSTPQARRVVGYLSPGDEVAGYRIEGYLGRGGMGTVYEATQLSLHRRVALKMLADERATDAAGPARMRREALLQAQLDHPNVIQVYEAGMSDIGPFIAMRLVRGDTLRAKLRGDAALVRARVLEWLGQIADALDAAHGIGLIHRDVKPGNILVDRHGDAFIADFGLARARLEPELTAAGRVPGTPGYVAPELARGAEPDAASDIYAFAATVQACLARTADGTLTPSMREVLARGMSACPGDRPTSARALVDELRAATCRSGPRGDWSAASAGLRMRHAAPAALLLAVVIAAAVVNTSTPKRWSVSLDTPMITPMSRAAFVNEHSLDPTPVPAADDARGATIEANLRSPQLSPRIAVTCTVRDLATGVSVTGTFAVGAASGEITSETVPCWVPATLTPGRLYRATLRLWSVRGGARLLTTAGRDFIVSR